MIKRAPRTTPRPRRAPPQRPRRDEGEDSSASATWPGGLDAKRRARRRVAQGWVDVPDYRGQPGQYGMRSQMSGAVVADAPGTPPTRITEVISAAANGKVKAN